MKIKVRENASANYIHRCYRHMPPTCGQMHNPTWAEMLEKVEGQWLDVDTTHLFRDQFNTIPIPGVSENGMRLMIEDIAEIQDDVRQGVIKCDWCFGYDNDDDGKCDQCGKSRYLHPLNPVVPY